MKEKKNIGKVKDSPQIEILKAINHEKQQNKFCATVEESAATHERFWDMLTDNEPCYERFLLLGYSLRGINVKIRRIWKLLKASSFKLSFKLMAIYAAFYDMILQDEKKSMKMKCRMADIGVLSGGNILLNYADNGCSVIALSAAAKTVGQVVRSNSAFCELTG